MIDLLLRYRRIVFLALLVGLIVSVRSLEDKDEDDYTALDRALVAVTAPMQSALRYVLDGIHDSKEKYLSNVRATERNAALELELADLRRKLASLDETQRENSRLLGLLGLRARSSDVQYLSARVIGNSTSALFRSVRIDVGSNDGVVRGMGVLSAEGVVGRVMNVAGNASEVMLIVDAASSIDVVVARSRARGRLRGLGDRTALTARIDYVSRSANVEERDTVLTTGAGTVFPKGLLVGWVTKVDRVEHGLYQEVMIEPAAKLLAMDEVLVVKTFGPAAAVEPAPEASADSPLETGAEAASQPVDDPAAESMAEFEALRKQLAEQQAGQSSVQSASSQLPSSQLPSSPLQSSQSGQASTEAAPAPASVPTVQKDSPPTRPAPAKSLAPAITAPSAPPTTGEAPGASGPE